jgi:hypothetical protein
LKQQLKNRCFLFIYIICGILITVLFPFLLKRNDFFSNASSLYFYSSHLQANAAIFSIFGLFFIFKIQSLQSTIETIKNGLYGISADVVNFNNKTLDEKELFIRDHPAQDNAIFKYYRKWLEIDKDILIIKESLKQPALILMIVLIIDSLGLMFSNYLNVLGYSHEIRIMLFVLFLQLYIIYMIIDIIKKSIE